MCIADYFVMENSVCSTCTASLIFICSVNSFFRNLLRQLVIYISAMLTTTELLFSIRLPYGGSMETDNTKCCIKSEHTKK